MIGWFIARHVIFLMVVYSVYHDSIEQTTIGCYSGSNANLFGPFESKDWTNYLEPFTNPQGIVCWNENVSNSFVYALLSLQVILCIWFIMIMKVAAKVIRGGEAVDSRSDDEDEGAEDEDDEQDSDEKFTDGRRHQQPIELPPLEEEVGVESLNLGPSKHAQIRRPRKSGTVASGVHLHSDRKELLGRIGCDKMGE